MYKLSPHVKTFPFPNRLHRTSRYPFAIAGVLVGLKSYRLCVKIWSSACKLYVIEVLSASRSYRETL